MILCEFSLPSSSTEVMTGAWEEPLPVSLPRQVMCHVPSRLLALMLEVPSETGKETGWALCLGLVCWLELVCRVLLGSTLVLISDCASLLFHPH